MSTERHHSRKRQGITIDAEAQNEVMAEAAVQPLVEPGAGATPADQPPFGHPADEAASAVETAKSQAAKAEPAKSGSAPSPSRSNSGALTGGILGAVLALAGAYGLQASGVLPTQNAGDSSVSDRISAMEANIASGTNSEGERIAALAAEVSALKDSVAALSQAAGNSSVADRVTALEQTASMATPATNGADLTALASRLATLESKSGDGSISEVLTTTRNALTTEINSLKSDLSALKTELADRASEPGLAAAVAVTALRAAVDRGGAFGAELENLAAVQPDAPAIAALRSFAALGVPTRQNLTAEFENAAQMMMAASEPVDPNATLLTKLFDSAKGLVKVRPVGTIEGDTAAARIGRMGEALSKSDDAAVKAEFAALPASSRSAGAVFMDRFNARAEADRLMAEAVLAASPKAGG